MAVDPPGGKMPQSKFSIESIRELESEGFARTKQYADSIQVLAGPLEAVSVAMQTHLAVRSIDSMNSLTAAARELKNLLETAGAA